MSNNMIQNFFEFIFNRQEIWHKRTVLRQEAPWSADEIFQTYKFCNVYRELDGGTLAISKYLHQPLSAEQNCLTLLLIAFSTAAIRLRIFSAVC